jgi:hypothetical protein
MTPPRRRRDCTASTAPTTSAITTKTTITHSHHMTNLPGSDTRSGQSLAAETVDTSKLPAPRVVARDTGANCVSAGFHW